MDGVATILQANTTVSSGLNDWADFAISKLDEIEKALDEPLDDAKLVKSVKDATSQISAKHKAIHSGISKLGKQIDKQFTSSYSNLLGVTSINDDVSRLNVLKSIIEHLYCSGYSEIAEDLEEESSVNLYPKDSDKKTKFVELAKLISSIREGDFDSSLEWIATNRSNLNANSMYEWKIRKCQYCRMLLDKTSSVEELIIASRKMTSCRELEAETEGDEIKMLMTALLYRNKLDDSETLGPFVKSLANSSAEICDELINDFSNVNGIHELRHEHLMSAHSAGCYALPALIGIKSVFEQRNMTLSKVFGENYLTDERKEVLPIEIKLPKRLRYHSVFSCPILREQTTLNNPPMRLVCGHVISKDARDKMADNSHTHGHLIKCPYCPTEQKSDQAQPLYF